MGPKVSTVTPPYYSSSDDSPVKSQIPQKQKSKFTLEPDEIGVSQDKNLNHPQKDIDLEIASDNEFDQ